MDGQAFGITGLKFFEAGRAAKKMVCGHCHEVFYDVRSPRIDELVCPWCGVSFFEDYDARSMPQADIALAVSASGGR